MERYTVSIRLPETGNSLLFLIPFPPASSVSTFAGEIKKRAAKYGSILNERNFSLHLGQGDGPILDFDDTLKDIILDPRSEHIFVDFKSLALSTSAKRIRLASSNGTPDGLGGFKIRPITPLLAKSSKDISSIPLLGNGTIINGHTTLRDIKAQIIEFLGLSVVSSVHSQGDNECNCAFARQIHQRGLWEKMDCQGCTSFTDCNYQSESYSLPISAPCALCSKSLSDHKGWDTKTKNDSGFASPCDARVFVRNDTSCGHWLHSQCLESGRTWTCPQSCLALPPSNQHMLSKFIVVHGKNNVEWLGTDFANRAFLIAKIREKFGDDVEERKAIEFVGEVQDPSRAAYFKLPVVSLCSRGRHTDRKIPDSSMETCSTVRNRVLDLHTSEAPIETTNLDLTVDQIGLRECTVNGVLNIYVIERVVSSSNPERGSGQDAIFTTADFWEHPISQSNRAMAAFLSSLRLFTDHINSKKMTQSSQNAILRLMLLFTRFPPALRAIYILMSARSPRPAESAALVQALYQVVKEMIPIELIESDEGRILEGSRLLFGFLLDRAAQLEDPDQDSLPYLWSMKTVDLKNFETLEPVEVPVLTSYGLVEEGYYNAYREDGILSWCNGEEPLEAGILDQRTRRIALLCGGIVPEVAVFDSDSLSSLAQLNDMGNEELIKVQAFSSLSHLATLCEHHNFAVVPPISLPSSTAPTLTVDRDGLLAVYTGRTPCSPPGADIAIFRPTKGGEETVDVAIITQLIAPILQQRRDDGTWIFDSFGGVQKQNEGVPDELIMFCVDCSRSMHRSSDFEEIKEESSDETTDDEEQAVPKNNDIEDGTYPSATLDQMKERILKYESFEDILAILKSTNQFYRPNTANRILEYMSDLFSRQLSHYLSKFDSMRGWATTQYLRNSRATSDSQITALKSGIAGLVTHKKALCDFILFRAGDFTSQNGPWAWNFGDEIPKLPKKSGQNTGLGYLLVVPHEYTCPIGREVFEDPVTASDGFTYERASIQRWFQSRNSSPSTGLDLTDTVTLARNVPLANAIKKWVDGEGLLQSPVRTSNRRSYLRESHRSIQFFSRLGSFTRRISPSASTYTLYRFAFQGMRGRYSHFDLHCNGTIIESSQRTGLPSTLRTGSVISINIHEDPWLTTPSVSQGTALQEEFEELCLIKVFSHSCSDALYAYWVPKNTTNTLASVLFRYWRHLSEAGSTTSHDMDIWSGLEYIGDGSFCGHVQTHWESLSRFLTKEEATGKLGPEAVYGEKPEPTTAESVDTDPGIGSSFNPLVLRLYLSRRSAKKLQKIKKIENLTRMDVSKQIFDAFINRTLAYNYSTRIGLITFDTTVKVSQEITNVLEDFRDSINKMKPKGDTALWDALALANDQLAEYGKKFPEARKRIICLSDGEDNKSSKRDHEIWWNLVQNKVVVDSFCVGDENNENLRTISYLSGGYKFHPQTLEQAMSICEMEPVLNQLERPPIRREPVPFLNTRRSGLFWSSKTKATPDSVTRDAFPQRKEHPDLEGQFVSLSALARSQRSPMEASRSTGPRSNSHIRSARLLSEMRTILANPHPQYDVYVSESNMGFWKVVMQGPPQSSYSIGTFLLYLDMEGNYPMFPPKGRFCTPIIHPNINRHGRVCHSILDRNWTLDTTNLQVLNTIYSLLLVPEFSDPINTVVTLNFHWDEVAFQEEVKEHIRRNATKSRSSWRAELLGE